MVADGERPLRILVVHSRFGNGFHVVMAPADLPEEQVETVLQELGVDAATYLELADWRTAECGVAVARVPFPARN
jgi:hypothetical protein